MTFTPRLTSAGISTSNFYIGTDNGGYDRYIGQFNPLSTPSIIGNCTWYCNGRAQEIAGSNIGSEIPNLGNATNWFGNGSCAWDREGYAVPTGHDGETVNFHVGDIMCWYGVPAGAYTAGHVETIEEINGNQLTISYSDYNSVYFGTFTITAPTINAKYKRSDGASGLNGLRFQGVIHNPYADVPPVPPTPLSAPIISAIGNVIMKKGGYTEDDKFYSS